MNTFKLSKPFILAALVVAVVLEVGLATFAGPCVHDDGSQAACFATSRALIQLGTSALAASLFALMVKNKIGGALLSAAAAIFGVLIAFLPGNVMQLCMMETMRCRAVMKPFCMVCGVLICALAIVDIVTGLRARQAEK